MSDRVAFRPHARLLTMLGQQLIKNDRIALVELVKNSYDADATLVEVDFQNFDRDGNATPTSSIVITDNGTGMSEEVVRGAWMNPATPVKRDRKRTVGRTGRGRVLQGEKGIGRFASFKLGSVVMLTTKTLESARETNLLVDLTLLDSDEEISDAEDGLFLDELAGDVSSVEPTVFETERSFPGQSGTRIEVTALRSAWGQQAFVEAFADLERMQPLMWTRADVKLSTGALTSPQLKSDFTVHFLVDGIDQNLAGQRQLEIADLFDRAVLKVTNGRFDEGRRMIQFSINDRPYELSVDSSEIRGLRPFRDRFGAEDQRPTFSCGPFGFEFYVFDFASTAPARHQLDRTDKAVLKNHRVYLYRDGIRVYPYGDADDDWLQVDRIRGTLSARSMFSNDQTVGYVSITQAANPGLQDKTNREGLLESGRSSGDLVALIQTVLAYLRFKPYEQYATANRRRREQSSRSADQVDRTLGSIIENRALPSNVRQDLIRVGEAITSEREISKLQLERTQDLAGVGLSVESASHDLIAAGTESLRIARQILRALREMGFGNEPIFSDMSSLVQRLEFVDSRFQDVQGLFVSSRQKRATLNVFTYVRRVKSMYASLHRSNKIEFEIDGAHEMLVQTTEAALLQCFINLVDNATYWLTTSPEHSRTIRVFSPGSNHLVFSDSGPGVPEDDEEYIFEPFYSGKGEGGKGLGLYIAREVGLRNSFMVRLGGSDYQQSLGGASFEVVFESSESA